MRGSSSTAEAATAIEGAPKALRPAGPRRTLPQSFRGSPKAITRNPWIAAAQGGVARFLRLGSGFSPPASPGLTARACRSCSLAWVSPPPVSLFGVFRLRSSSTWLCMTAARSFMKSAWSWAASLRSGARTSCWAKPKMAVIFSLAKPKPLVTATPPGRSVVLVVDWMVSAAFRAASSMMSRASCACPTLVSARSRTRDGISDFGRSPSVPADVVSDALSVMAQPSPSARGRRRRPSRDPYARHEMCGIAA